MAQRNADIEALSKSCMLIFKNKMHVKEAIDTAIENLRTFMELEAIKALAENTKMAITENEDVQDIDQQSAASVESEVEMTVELRVVAAAAPKVSIDSEGVQ